MKTEPSFDQSWKSMYERDAWTENKRSSCLRSQQSLLGEAWRRARHVANLMKEPARLAEMIRSMSEFSGLAGAKALDAWLDERFAPFVSVFRGFNHGDLIAGVESGKLNRRAFVAGVNPALLSKPTPKVRAPREVKPGEADNLSIEEQVSFWRRRAKELEEGLRAMKRVTAENERLRKELDVLMRAFRRAEGLEEAA